MALPVALEPGSGCTVGTAVLEDVAAGADGPTPVLAGEEGAVVVRPLPGAFVIMVGASLPASPHPVSRTAASRTAAKAAGMRVRICIIHPFANGRTSGPALLPVYRMLSKNARGSRLQK